MRRILVTGMSGTGKSSALAELARRGGHRWNEERIAQLLAEEGLTLYVSATVSNQGASTTASTPSYSSAHRRTCMLELHATQPLAVVVERLVQIGGS